MKLLPDDREWINKALQAIDAAEAGPSAADIANAPVLSDWMPAVSPFAHVILVGEVVGHPILGTRSITTSQLIAIHPEAGWARTVSRWYGLAQPKPASKEIFASNLGLKSPIAARFAITGFITLADLGDLDEILSANIVQIRQIDAADRAASEQED